MWKPIRTGKIRDGISAEFEAFGRTVVGSGCSGRHARDTLLLAADYLLIEHEATQFKDDLPTTHWFARQREAVGSESFVFACLELAACENIIQWGFDELFGRPVHIQPMVSVWFGELVQWES